MMDLTRQPDPNLFDPALWRWIEEQAAQPVDKLRLKYGLEEPFYSALAQIEARKKWGKKFPTLTQGSWIFPVGVPLEQSSSEATASFKGQLVSYLHLVDLTGGTGIDSWGFAQHAATIHHLIVEQQPELARLLKHNIPNAHVLTGESEKLLNTEIKDWLAMKQAQPEQTCFYLDPDRRATGQKLADLSSARPNILEIQGQLFEHAHTVMSKHSPMANLSELYRLEGLEKLYAIQLRGENKELIAIQKKGYVGPVEHIAQELNSMHSWTTWLDVDAGHDGWMGSQVLEEVEVLPIEESVTLIQPGPALLKLGLDKLLAQLLGWKKLPFGALYGRESIEMEVDDSFKDLGLLWKEYFIVEQSAPYKYQTRVERAAVECIGFPETADQVRKKLKVKEGDEWKVFALKNGRKKAMLLTKRIQ